jgi:TIR domain
VSYKYSCFFSYRGANNDLVSDFILKLHSALSEMIGKEPVFMDAARLNSEKNMKASDLAKALNQSACMLLVYTPNYFSKHYPCCTKEYLAMQRLESKRLQQLKSKGLFADMSLIIPIVFRGGAYLPEEVAQRRPIFNFEDFLLADTDFDSIPKFTNELNEIAEYISKCSMSIEAISQESSINFSLPTDIDVDKFLSKLESQPQSFPRRSHKTPVPLYVGR